MSTTEPIETMAEPWDDSIAPPPLRAPRGAASIVPSSSIAGRSLTAVVAIMTFLAALTIGAAMLVVSAASDWRADVGREVTIQVRPAAGRDIEADVRKAVEIARAAAGIADVRAYHQGGIRQAGRALARRRARARGTADPAHDRRQACCPARRRISPRCARRSPPRCRAPASTIIAAGSTACAPWRAPPSWPASRCWCWCWP